MREEEIERRRNVFIRGNDYSAPRLRQVCEALSCLGNREVIPYEVVKYDIVESGWEETRLYVVTTRFSKSGIYDVSINLPREREFDLQYGRCWERAVELLEREVYGIKEAGHKVKFDKEIKIFEDYPRPTVHKEVMTMYGNESTIELALRYRSHGE